MDSPINWKGVNHRSVVPTSGLTPFPSLSSFPSVKLSLSLLLVQRTSDPNARLNHYVGIDLRRGDIYVPKQILHCADVGPAFQQVRGERVAQRARCDSLA